MQKKFIALLLSALGGLQALPALAAAPQTTMQCEPPVLQVPHDPAIGATQYTVGCQGSSTKSLAPAVRFSGELLTRGSPPYDIKASYTINVQSSHAKKLNLIPRLDQVVSGALTASAVSAASLPAQFAAQTVWDASTGTLSVEESAGLWRVFSVDFATSGDEPGVVEAGVASVAVKSGRAVSNVVLGANYSRFAGKSAGTLPVVKAELRLRDGKLEVQMGETRVSNQAAVQGALLSLDRQPKDITRAWALASRARFLGLDDEVRYAEQKVAAHNPNLLEEFQISVERIKPYIVPSL